MWSKDGVQILTLNHPKINLATFWIFKYSVSNVATVPNYNTEHSTFFALFMIWDVIISRSNAVTNIVPRPLIYVDTYVYKYLILYYFD